METIALDLLDEVIIETVGELDAYSASSTQFAEITTQVNKLLDIRKKLTNPSDKEVEITSEKSSTTLKDWIPVIGSVSGILAIVIFESFGHSMTSKATSFVKQIK